MVHFPLAVHLYEAPGGGWTEPTEEERTQFAAGQPVRCSAVWSIVLIEFTSNHQAVT